MDTATAHTMTPGRAKMPGQPTPGAERVLAVFDALEQWLSGQDHGCAFVNAYAEIGGTTHPGMPVIRGEKAWMREYFEHLVRDAGFDAPSDVGGHLHLLYEGAIVMLTAGDLADSIRQARAAADGVLRSSPRA